jgi:hypothetical protein
MKLRSVASLGILLLCSAAFAQGVKPWQPPTGTTPTQKAKPLRIIDGVPDTGQFVPDSAVLARFDGRPFRAIDFCYRWYAAYAPDRPNRDSAGRYMFLDNMMNKEVLASLARQVNRPFTFEDRQQLRDVRQRWMANVVFARLVADSSRPTLEDAQHIYEQTKFELHLQRIVANDRAAVERARADVLAKRLSWQEAVKKYSTGRGDKGPDGDLGWMKRAALAPVVAWQVFDLADGQLSTLFQDLDGWQFVRVLGRRPVRVPVFSSLRKLFLGDAYQVKLADRMEQVRAEIRRRIGMSYDSTNIAWASDRFGDQRRAFLAENDARTIDLSGQLPDFQPADTSREMAHWQGGHLTLSGVLETLSAIAGPQRPHVETFDGLRGAIDAAVFEPYMAEMAHERGYDDDPLVTAEVARTEEQLRVQHLYSDSVEFKISITPQQRRKFFAEHKAEFRTLQNVTYAAIIRFSKAGVDSLAARLKAGESAVAILRADSLAGFTSGSIKSEREDDHEAFHQIIYEEMRPGDVQVVGPDKLGTYMAVQKLTHDRGRSLTYDEAAGVVDEALQNQDSERKLQRLLARYRPQHRVEMHPELLMRVDLRNPATQ